MAPRHHFAANCTRAGFAITLADPTFASRGACPSMMRLIPALMLVTAWLALAPVARGQATSYDGRPIAEVKLEG